MATEYRRILRAMRRPRAAAAMRRGSAHGACAPSPPLGGEGRGEGGSPRVDTPEFAEGPPHPDLLPLKGKKERERTARLTSPATLLLLHRSRVAIGPQRLARQRHRGGRADVVARRGAELDRLEPLAEQVDVVGRLGALVAAAA